MALVGREVDLCDHSFLKNFRAAGSGDYVDDVNGWVAGLLEWRLESDDGPRFVRVYEYDGERVAVSAFSRYSDPVEGTFIALIAVKQGWERRRIGSAILRGLIENATRLHPGGEVVFRVDTRNKACLGMCTAFNFEDPVIADDDRLMFEYVVPL